MKSPLLSNGSVRTKRILAMGATAAVLFSGAGLIAANTNANAATSAAAAASIEYATLKSADTGAQTQAPGGAVISAVRVAGSTNWQYWVATRLVDAETGEAVTGWNVQWAERSYTKGGWETRIAIPNSAAGRKVVAQDYIFNEFPLTGTPAAPGADLKSGIVADVKIDSLTDPARTVTVSALPNVKAPITAPVAPIGSQPTTTPGTSPSATIVTTATDKADGDKSVAVNGIIKDVVNYTGLNPGGVYVLQTTLWNKTDGFATPVNISKIFVPKTAAGTITVEVPVPAGYDGKDLVVFQTIYNGADAVVGKHLDVVKIRDGKTYIVAHRDPNDTAQTVTVPALLQPCKQSGYVWKDANLNGIMDASEEKVAGVKADLHRIQGNSRPGVIAQTTTTDANGYYEFTIAPEDCVRYYVDFEEKNFPTGWVPFAGGESDLLPGAELYGQSLPYSIVPGQNYTRLDAGLRPATTGIVQGGFCVPGVKATANLIDKDGKVVASTTVDPSSNWSFTNVPAGDYKVRFNSTFTGSGYGIIKGGDIVERAYWGGDNGWSTWAETAVFTLDQNEVERKYGCGMWISPLSLDLNGNGKVDTSSVASQAGAGFDLLSTGSKVDSGWVAKGDGLLVTPNADGTVTSGDNLFGGSLGDGYAKLAKLDTNNDGAVSGAELDGVKVWVDANSDHVSQAGEIKSLGDYGIVSLSTKYTNAPVVDNGNVVVEHGVATKADGSSVVVGDAYFQLGAVDAANAAAAGKAQAATNAKLATLPVAEAKSIREAFKNAAK